LPRADVDGNLFPAPGIDLQTQCGKGFLLQSAAIPCSWR
jgi:hypothetical protein